MKNKKILLLHYIARLCFPPRLRFFIFHSLSLSMFDKKRKQTSTSDQAARSTNEYLLLDNCKASIPNFS